MLGQFTGNGWGSDAQKEGVSCSTGYRQGWLLTYSAIQCRRGMVPSQPM